MGDIDVNFVRTFFMEAYVYDHVRTPRGKGRPDGALHEITSVEMATQLLHGLVTGQSGERVDDFGVKF